MFEMNLMNLVSCVAWHQEAAAASNVKLRPTCAPPLDQQLGGVAGSATELGYIVEA